MYFKSKIDEYGTDKIKLFVDMDGVVADYDIGGALNYENKRPLITNIKQIEEISKYKNIEVFILSVTRHNTGINEKQNWLDKNMSFIKSENRILLSREDNEMKRSRYIKAEYLKNVDDSDCKIILIDDDPTVLDEIQEQCQNVITMKDTVLVD